MKPFLTFCALCCFIGIFRLPIEYYTFLRILISIGALLVLYNTLSSKQHYFSIIFLVIFILFNPVFPIYLYRKNIWIPIDIITGILFLLISFIERKEQKKEEEITEETSEPSIPIHQRTVSRDRIINPEKTKE
ncbi:MULTISPECIES: DUF6804 family protein [Chryseobacterium]|jgi:hypothetical protein|uniref:FUSC family protein n=1 Tax=Chryseobacterium candidae TaxID=1978493 RepID=A0ABY2R4V2_9FLAO|nr:MULTISPECIES: DUF6804 family protein [Chryseobacterium]PXW14504.1 hypothetical protein C8D70_107213 [Chryseobacterium sp. CBTAP 102]THV56727.1 hypothetical protein EK417_18625 [Chryseobacterium candidae]